MKVKGGLASLGWPRERLEINAVLHITIENCDSATIVLLQLKKG